jgi:hypothetical protein
LDYINILVIFPITVTKYLAEITQEKKNLFMFMISEVSVCFGMAEWNHSHRGIQEAVKMSYSNFNATKWCVEPQNND